MSFGEKFVSIMQRPGEDPVSKDDVPWWLKYSGRGLGTVGGAIAIIIGLWNCIGILLGNVGCLITGMWQMVTGFLIITIEAPCCCLFVDFVQQLSTWADERPYWNRAAGYWIIAIMPVLLWCGFSSFFSSALIFGTGVLYGMMSLGKKAPLNEMRTTATHQGPIPPTTTSMKSTLVENAQPMGFAIPDNNPV